MPEIEELAEIVEIAEMPELPNLVMESMDGIKFDYEAYQKDGDVYMKKWQKQWKNGFNEKKFKEGMEKWQKSFQKQQEKLTELKGKITKQRKAAKSKKVNLKHYEKQLARIQELEEISKDLNKDKLKELLEGKEQLLKFIEQGEQNRQIFNLNGKVNFNMNTNDDNVFYISSGNKRFKVKKTIKIKMPKKTKLKLNVRHGEVTLASTSENINAKLSHAALYANVINGANTTIESSYAPIHVTKWNNGSLKVNFTENVDLQFVDAINLMSNSSSVIVGNLGTKGIISGTFGDLLIHNMSEDFQTLDIILENTDARIQLPETAFKLYYIGSNSSISYPESVIGNENKTQFNTIVRGYQKANNTGKEININAKYSEVSLKVKS
jgi:hypothetical protein